MKLTFATFMLTGLATTAGAPSSDLRFAAEKGVSVRKTFQEQTTWSLGSIEQIVDGSPTGLPTPEMTGKSERRLTVVDTCTSVDAGVALELVREFETVEGHSGLDFEVQGATEQFALDMSSELDGGKVIFERKTKGSEPEPRFAPESKASSKLLEGLRDDLDLRAFLTEEGVGVGDWWKVDAATLVDVLAPGGELWLVPKKGAVPPEQLQILDASDVLATTLCGLAENTGDLAGEVLCTWKETKTEGEREIAVIEVEWESTSRTDASERLARRMRAAGEDTSRTELEVVMSVTAEGRGQLLWDLGSSRAIALALALEAKFDVTFGFNQEGSDVAYHFTLDAESALKSEFEVQ